LQTQINKSQVILDIKAPRKRLHPNHQNSSKKELRKVNVSAKKS